MGRSSSIRKGTNYSFFFAVLIIWLLGLQAAKVYTCTDDGRFSGVLALTSKLQTSAQESGTGLKGGYDKSGAKMDAISPI